MADDEVEPQVGEATTVNYGWIKPTVGASDDAWGGYVNSDLDGIDTTVKSVSNIANAAVAKAGDTMTGALAIPAGSATAAGLTFGTPGTGLYSANGTVRIDFTTSGVGRFTISTSAVTCGLQIQNAIGAVGAPAYSFVGGLTSGFYRSGTNQISAATNGVETMRWNADNSTTALGAVTATGFIGPIGATTPNTGVFTNLTASGTVSGAGFTSLLAPYALTTSVPVASSTTPGMDGTAAIGTGTTFARADHIHPSDTSKLSLTGTTTNDNAAAGAVGEYISSNVLSGSSILMTTAVVLNITSISLTAGDWDVQGEVWLSTGAAANLSQAWGSISTVSGALGGGGAAQAARCGFAVAFSPSTIQVFPLRTTRFSIATTTTVYLTALAGFSAGGVNAYGNISARRAR